VLLACNADGSVDHWHITSGRRLHTVTEADNQIFAVDYCADGSKFVAAGKDKKLRIYDEATKALRTTLEGGFGSSSPGHSNRVFSLKFKPDDENLLVSGGWDNTVQIWDLRTECSVRSFFGPHICGDAVDLQGNTVLTGSWRPENPVQLWDFTTGKLIADVPFDRPDALKKDQSCQVYAAQFHPNGLFCAGGSGRNELKVFDGKAGNSVCGSVEGLERAVFTVDFTGDGSMLALGGGDSAIRVYDVVNNASLAGLSEAEYRAATTINVGA
jgi:WD40 repeat protein